MNPRNPSEFIRSPGVRLKPGSATSPRALVSPRTASRSPLPLTPVGLYPAPFAEIASCPAIRGCAPEPPEPRVRIHLAPPVSLQFLALSGESGEIPARAGFAATEGYRRVDHRSVSREFGRISLCAAVIRFSSQNEATGEFRSTALRHAVSRNGSAMRMFRRRGSTTGARRARRTARPSG